MATAAAVQQPPSLEEEEIDDDFVLIELVLDGSQRDKSTPKEPDRSKKQNPKSGPPKVPDSIPNFEDYEDFVEITVEEANLPESRSEDNKRSLYGVRLFQYSPESEGNIYITNEEL
uniref:Uncharacterized protein n=1 Tax=Amphimedon queenslandica TaxID=400682 RepID=A0A1X7VFQ4_AMPQE